MLEELYFNSDHHFVVSAASVGISKQRWISIESDVINHLKPEEIMMNERIDVLPIIEKNNEVREYFITDSPDVYTLIHKKAIHYHDTIPFDTDIAVVISRLKYFERRYFFLTRHKKIVGLITIGNLNCKQVQVYLFNILCELETLLSGFVNDCLTQDQIVSWVELKAKNNNKFSDILNKYYDLRDSDLENQLTEHFFFIDLFTIIKETSMCEKLGFSKTKWESFYGINEIRKRIAHPTRSLLDSENSIDDLYTRIGKINELIFCLKNIY